MSKKDNITNEEVENTCNCGEECNCKNETVCTCTDECNCTESNNCGCLGEECQCDCGEECSCANGCNCTLEDDCSCCNKNSDDYDRDEEEILILKNNIEHLNEKVKQAQAELINYRKRKDEEVLNIKKFANQDLIIEILPILDNFERALNMKNTNPEFDKYSEGYKLLYSHLADTLKKFGVEEIPAIDCEFDPNLHEAVMIGSDEDKEEDIILEVFSKGYKLKDRVIRASKVRVNKL